MSEDQIDVERPRGVGDEAVDSGEPESGDDRGRSTIRFPYNDLTDVEELAVVLHTERAGQTDVKTLASDMDLSATSGSFRNKINAGVIFGVFDTQRGGTIRLTELGERLADPDQQDEARVDAFLAVPLYAQVYENHHGKPLPSERGIEDEMVRLGVAPKQAARARQVLMRSAEKAGFFAKGRSRLVEPPLRRAASPPKEAVSPAAERSSAPTLKVMEHPLIQGLLQVLPEPGQPFPQDRREAWVEALKTNMQFIWPETPPSAPQRPSEQSRDDVQD